MGGLLPPPPGRGGRATSLSLSGNKRAGRIENRARAEHSSANNNISLESLFSGR